MGAGPVIAAMNGLAGGLTSGSFARARLPTSRGAIARLKRSATARKRPGASGIRGPMVATAITAAQGSEGEGTRDG